MGFGWGGGGGGGGLLSRGGGGGIKSIKTLVQCHLNLIRKETLLKT